MDLISSVAFLFFLKEYLSEESMWDTSTEYVLSESDSEESFASLPQQVTSEEYQANQFVINGETTV